MQRLSPVDVSFLDQEKRRLPHARRGGDDLRGAAAVARGVPRAHRVAPAPGAALPAEARLSRGSRWAGRCGSTTRASTSTTTSATRRCPAPGSVEQLRLLTGRIFSQRLDRTKPLWELWLVQGLEGDRFAIINKTHHSLVDGVSGVDLTTVLFDTSPTPTPVGAEGWTPQPEPSEAAARGGGRQGPRRRCPPAFARRAVDAARRPRETAAEIGEAAEGLGGIAWKLIEPAAADALQRADRAAPPGDLECVSRSPT